jgi:hypothetical protein
MLTLNNGLRHQNPYPEEDGCEEQLITAATFRVHLMTDSTRSAVPSAAA